MEVKCKDGKLWISLARRVGKKALVKAVAEGIRAGLRQKEMIDLINKNRVWALS
jgi:hypothetical protein